MKKKTKIIIISTILSLASIAVALGVYFGIYYKNTSNINDKTPSGNEQPTEPNPSLPTADELYEFDICEYYGEKGYKLVRLKTQTINNYEIPAYYNGEPVIAIAGRVFADHREINSITLPDTIKVLEDYALDDCTMLKQITINSGVVKIGNEAFRHCSLLSEIELPASVTSIGTMAFADCTSLKTVRILTSVDYILGENAFSNCLALESIYLNNHFTYEKPGEEYKLFNGISLKNLTINAGEITDAFNKTTLETLKIGPNVTYIVEQAFSNCCNLKSIEVDSKNSKYSVSSNCLIDTDTNTLLRGCNLNTNIPNNVTRIGERAFAWCSNISSITIPNTVETISELAFIGCTSLTSLTIPSSVNSIGMEAFSSCLNLKSLILWKYPAELSNNAFLTTGIENLTINFGNVGTAFSIPSLKTLLLGTVSSIASGAFNNCYQLTTITFNSSVPPAEIGDNWAPNVLEKIIVPYIALEKYKQALPEYADIIDIS